MVGKSAAPWTLKRLFRWSALSAAVVVALALILSSGFAAAAAYRLPLIETLYMHFLQS